MTKSTPRDPRLVLEVEQHSCSCGNQWTNSYVRYINGGTPVLGPVDTITYIDLFPYTKQHLKCFACTDPALLRRDPLPTKVQPKNPLDDLLA